MNNKIILAFFVFQQFLSPALAINTNISPQKSEEWQEKYSNNDVKGSQVIAMWSFDKKHNSGYDDSGNGNNAEKKNYDISKHGKFGSCLRIHNKKGVNTFTIKNNRYLTPNSDFSIEMWINPFKEYNSKEEIILLDNMYEQNSGYKITLVTDSLSVYYLSVSLGFGVKTILLKSDTFHIENNTWKHIAFTYDGCGKGKLYLNGYRIGEYYESGVSQLNPSNKDLTIGSKKGKGVTDDLQLKIDEVRISSRKLNFSSFEVEIFSERKVFLRMEENAFVKLRLINLTNKSIENFTLDIGWGWGGLGSRFKHSKSIKKITVEKLQEGSTYDIIIPIDTKLRPDKYFLTINYSDQNNKKKYLWENFEFEIVNRKLPDEYPVVMWGPSFGAFGVLDKLKDIGFTHAFGIDVDYGKIWDAGAPALPDTESYVKETRKNLDNALAKGITIVPQLRPAIYLDTIGKYKRIDRNGQVYKKSHLNVLFPEIKEYCFNVGASLAQVYGDLPAFGGALLHSETRDISFPSFQEIDKALYKEYSGKDIPMSVKYKRGDNYKVIKGFPKDRVIADSDSLYTYFKWYWKDGDGWNKVNDELHKGLKTLPNNRSDFWTFHDPAVRAGSVYGSGGMADVISHWTYTYPDPLKIGLTTDELLCMANGANHKQNVMSMTQIIWYRSQMAPTTHNNRKFEPKTTAPWEEILPPTGLQYISISPTHLSEAFWTKISRPITGIMYHGWQSLVPDQYHSSYLFTNDATSSKLKELIKNVIEPLGPTLKNIPGIKSDIAFYQSFAAQIYAGRGTMGWAGTWLGDSYIMLNYAGLQPDIVYDETITKEGLKDFKILVMMDCDVITESVRDIIIDFQKGGGIVIADKELSPAISPNIVIERFNRTGHAFNDKSHLMKLAADLSESLRKHNYKSYISTSNKNLITYLRKYNNTDYVFLINENREYGDYAGQHGLVMENGKPIQSKLSINRSKGFAYDLVNNRYIDNFINGDKFISTDVSLGSGDGGIIMITDKRIDNIKIQGPEKLYPGESAKYRILVCDDTGGKIDAVIPIQIEIKDSEGRVLEKSGYWKALDGILDITIDVAENDIRGIWQIKAKELASGKSVCLYPRMGNEIIIESYFEDKEKADSFQPNG